MLAGLITTVMLSTPAMACKNCLRHVAKKANASGSPTARFIDGYARILAPHVIVPVWCDIGDNQFMCCAAQRSVPTESRSQSVPVNAAATAKPMHTRLDASLMSSRPT